MERTLENLMYEIPSDEDIVACTVTKEAVEATGEPEIERKSK
jgi:ATP-dependent Clp protease ATP-binding subunit ClpX